MGQAESSNWIMNAAERQRARKIEEENAKRAAEGGKPVIRPQAIIKSGLRILSVGRIIIAAITPGSIALYWVTSAAFGLCQTWLTNWLDRPRALLPRESASSKSANTLPESSRSHSKVK